MRGCIISLATSHKHYPQGLRRLVKSARRSGFAGEFITWPPGRFPDGCPTHQDVPFAFKPYCFWEARRRGQQLVLWLDASCVVVRSLEPIYRQIEERGYVLFRNDSLRLGEWASDQALERLGLGREEALRLPEVNAAAIGLNLESPIALNFLNQWHEAARDGVAFRGVRHGAGSPADYSDIKWNRSGRASVDPRVRGHRHDQTVAGVLAFRLGLELTRDWLQSYTYDDWKVGDRTLIVIDRSVARLRSRVTPIERILSESGASAEPRPRQWLRQVRQWLKS